MTVNRDSEGSLIIVLVEELQTKANLRIEYVSILMKHCSFQGGKNSIKLGDYLVPKGRSESLSRAQYCPLLLAGWALSSRECQKPWWGEIPMAVSISAILATLHMGPGSKQQGGEGKKLTMATRLVILSTCFGSFLCSEWSLVIISSGHIYLLHLHSFWVFIHILLPQFSSSYQSSILSLSKSLTSQANLLAAAHERI